MFWGSNPLFGGSNPFFGIRTLFWGSNPLFGVQTHLFGKKNYKHKNFYKKFKSHESQEKIIIFVKTIGKHCVKSTTL